MLTLIRNKQTTAGAKVRETGMKKIANQNAICTMKFKESQGQRDMSCKSFVSHKYNMSMRN